MRRLYRPIGPIFILALLLIFTACSGKSNPGDNSDLDLKITKTDPIQGSWGTEVRIFGQSFNLATDTVFFGNTEADFADESAEQAALINPDDEPVYFNEIVVIVPEGVPLGAVMVQVKGPDAKSNTHAFTVTLPSLTDSENPEGGILVAGNDDGEEEGDDSEGGSEGGTTGTEPEPKSFVATTFTSNPGTVWLTDNNEAFQDSSVSWSVGPDSPDRVVIRRLPDNAIVAQYEGAVAKSGIQDINIMGTTNFKLEVFDDNVSPDAPALEKELIVEAISAIGTYPFDVTVEGEEANQRLGPWNDYEVKPATVHWDFPEDHPYDKICLTIPSDGSGGGGAGGSGSGFDVINMDTVIQVKTISEAIPKKVFQFSPLDAGELANSPFIAPTKCFSLGGDLSGERTFTPTVPWTRIKYYARIDSETVGQALPENFVDVQFTKDDPEVDLEVARAVDEDAILVGATNVIRLEYGVEYADKVILITSGVPFGPQFIEKPNLYDRIVMEPLNYTPVSYAPAAYDEKYGYYLADDPQLNLKLNKYFKDFTKKLYKVKAHFPVGATNPYAMRQRGTTGDTVHLAFEPVLINTNVVIDGYINVWQTNHDLTLNGWGSANGTLYLPMKDYFKGKAALVAFGEGGYYIKKTDKDTIPAPDLDKFTDKPKSQIFFATMADLPYDVKVKNVRGLGNANSKPELTYTHPSNCEQEGALEAVPEDDGEYRLVGKCIYKGNTFGFRFKAKDYLGNPINKTRTDSVQDLPITLGCAGSSCTSTDTGSKYGLNITLKAEVQGYNGGPWPYKKLKIYSNNSDCDSDGEGTVSPDDDDNSYSKTFNNWGFDCHTFHAKAQRLSGSWTTSSATNKTFKHVPQLSFEWRYSEEDYRSHHGYTSRCVHCDEGFTGITSCIWCGCFGSNDVEFMQVAYRAWGEWTKRVECQYRARDDDSSNRTLQGIDNQLEDVENKKSWGGGGETARLLRMYWNDESDWTNICVQCTAYGADGQQVTRSSAYRCTDSSGCSCQGKTYNQSCSF